MYTHTHTHTHTHTRAGSTGSRVHVYRWVWKDGDKLPNITDDFFHQVYEREIEIKQSLNNTFIERDRETER
jgi:hypothetical protein